MPDVDRLSPGQVQKHTEAAIEFIVAAVKNPRNSAY